MSDSRGALAVDGSRPLTAARSTAADEGTIAQPNLRRQLERRLPIHAATGARDQHSSECKSVLVLVVAGETGRLARAGNGFAWLG